MLVYANHLTLEGSGAPNAIFRSVGRWLKEQMGRGLHPIKLKSDGKHYGKKRDGIPSTLRIYTASENENEYYAWVLKHPDKEDQGRQWITEIGVESGSEKLDISFVVRTEEMSARVEPPSVSRPRVIQYVVENIKKADDASFSEKSIPVYKTKEIGEDSYSYRALRFHIEEKDRRYPIVLVSPTTEGGYLLDADYLQEKLIGLAQVVRIIPSFNINEMEKILGKFRSACAGAVDILHTPNRLEYSPIRPYSYSAENINSWGDGQNDRASEILSLVTHETNRPYYNLRIRPEKIIRRAMDRASERSLLEATEITADKYKETIKKLLHERDKWFEMASNLSDDVDGLNADLELKEGKINEMKEKIHQKSNTIEYLEDRLKNKKSDPSVNFLINLLQEENLTPLNCLEVIEKIHGDKCVVLGSAKKSAEKSSDFEEGRNLLRYLILLVTEYRDALINGGDSQSKDIFRGAYASGESENLPVSMVKKRTFEYDGKPTKMLNHLKIGVSQDENKTNRTHFHWDGEKRVVVIGHCGRHLPLPKPRKGKK